jgi:hypothetical protein
MSIHQLYLGTSAKAEDTDTDTDADTDTMHASGTVTFLRALSDS